MRTEEMMMMLMKIGKMERGRGMWALTKSIKQITSDSDTQCHGHRRCRTHKNSVNSERNWQLATFSIVNVYCFPSTLVPNLFDKHDKIPEITHTHTFCSALDFLYVCYARLRFFRSISIDIVNELVWSANLWYERWRSDVDEDSSAPNENGKQRSRVGRQCALDEGKKKRKIKRERKLVEAIENNHLTICIPISSNKCSIIVWMEWRGTTITQSCADRSFELDFEYWL